MKLFFAPGACSRAPMIALCEAGLSFETVKVDLATKKTADGADYRAINPLGKVPALQFDGGEVLTECVAILTAIAMRVPEKNLLPAGNGLAFLRHLETMNFLSTELHKTLGGLFNPRAGDAEKAAIKDLALQRFAMLDARLEGQSFLFGETFTVADAYLFTLAAWTDMVGMDISSLKHLAAFRARVSARDGVQKALALGA